MNPVIGILKIKNGIFLPRRVSTEMYDEKVDLTKGSNVMLIASEDFKNIEVLTVGKITPTRGFSSFKFIPERDWEIVALKTEENNNSFKSYITVFTITGEILMEETEIRN